MTNRRQFLRAGAMLVAGTAAGSLGALPALGMDAVSRKGKGSVKVGCAAYSYRKYLTAKEDPMTLDVFLEKAAEMGCDGVELTSYYFPKDATSEYLNRVKRKAFTLGLDVTSTSVGNNFCLPAGPERDKNLSLVKTWVDRSAELGAPCMRIFAGSAPKGQPAEDVRRWVVECIGECLDLAGKRGVILAMENHGNFTSTAASVMAIADQIKSDWFGINLDSGNFVSPDPYADMVKVAPYTVTTHVKTQVHGPDGRRECDYGRVAGVLRDAGYRGYLILEYEGAEEPAVAVPRTIGLMHKAAG